MLIIELPQRINDRKSTDKESAIVNLASMKLS